MLQTEQQPLNAAILGRLLEFVGDHEAGARGVDELRQIIEFANASGAGTKIKIDPSLARGLSYYTGAIMEINVPDLAGSLGGGGRYDNLWAFFPVKCPRACFSLALDAISSWMTEREFSSRARRSNGAVRHCLGEESISDSLRLAAELPRLSFGVSYRNGQLGNLSSILGRGIAFVAVI